MQESTIEQSQEQRFNTVQKSAFKSKNLILGQSKISAMVPALLVTNLTTKLDEISMNLALPIIQKDLNLSESSAQWLSATFFIAAAAFAIPLGKLSDSFGLINTFIALLLLCTVVRLACFFTTNFPLLLVLRFITGALAAGCIALRNAMNTRYPSKEQQSKAIGITMILNQLCSIIIPLISGYFLKKIDWKYQFVIASALSLISAIMLIPFENPAPIKKKTKSDIFGSLFITLTVSFFCLIFTLISSKHYVGAGICVVASIIFGVSFVFVEKKHPDPVLPLKIMTNPVSDLFIQNVLNWMTGAANGWLLPQLLDDASISGIVSAIGALLTLITAIVCPIITKKVVNRYVLQFGYVFSTICIVLQIIFARNTMAYMILYVIIGFFSSIVMQTIYPMTLLSVSAQYSSLVSAFPTTSRTIGNSMSLSIFSSITMLVHDALIKKNNDEKLSFVRGAQASLSLVVLLSLIGLFDAIFRIGNSRLEQGKKGFKQNMIREHKEKEDNEGLLLLRDVAANPSTDGIKIFDDESAG
ncbi:Major_facilitator superfamily protein [Hexamita inflata]|uniref:Major facilitator superfamily protein n=1 Tax=Hexamita inflata TaxID=28002 RepID=A0AA86NFC4_9EUKA|nr:Major facilitator superfamily protein [Hexamita inflata]